MRPYWNKNLGKTSNNYKPKEDLWLLIVFIVIVSLINYFK